MHKEADKKTSVCKDDTIATVIDLMRKFQRCSRAELSKASGLVRSTITNIIDMLIKSDLVLETGFISKNCGRRSIQIMLNADKLVALGIAVTHKYYTLAIVDIFGNVRVKEKHLFSGDFVKLDISAAFEGILDTAERFLKENAENPIGIGLSLPGPYLMNEKRILLLTETGWKKYSFTEMFESRFQIPTFMERDTNAGAMGEWWFGKSEIEYGTKMFVSTGDGVGVGIVVDGKIYHGESGTPGELGHMSVNFKGPKCSCGNRGCLEMYCTEDEIKRQIDQQMALGYHGVFSQPLRDFDDIILAYHNGNLIVSHIVDKVAEIMGIGLANLIYLYDPGIIIIGGSLSKLGDKFLEAVKTSVKNHTYPFFHEKVAFMLSSLSNDPMVIGAAAVVFDHILKTPMVLIDKMQ